MGLRDWVSEKVLRCDLQTSASKASMGLRYWVSEKAPDDAHAVPVGGASMGLRDWVSEKGLPGLSVHARLNPASMGLRDWVSEKGHRARLPVLQSPWASMGLRDWVSEKAGLATDNAWAALVLQWGSETGSRRRGGTGWSRTAQTAPLQWGSETGSRRRSEVLHAVPNVGIASMGLRDWVSEKASRGTPAPAGATRFNGAPRLGLGEGRPTGPATAPTRALQWGSETGSRRRIQRFSDSIGNEFDASMGLRDWVSEKAAAWWAARRAPPGFNGAPRLGLGEGSGRMRLRRRQPSRRLQWGSETGSRRRRRSDGRRGVPRCASMGLRDWVSEKAASGPRRPQRVSRFNGAPRLGLGEGT